MNTLTTPHLLRGGNDKNVHFSTIVLTQRPLCNDEDVSNSLLQAMVPKNFFRVHHSWWWDHPVSQASSYIQSLDCDDMIGLWCCLLYRALIVFDERTWPDTWRFVVKRRTDFTSIESFVSVNIWLAWTQVSRKKIYNPLFLSIIQQTFY